MLNSPASPGCTQKSRQSAATHPSKGTWARVRPWGPQGPPSSPSPGHVLRGIREKRCVELRRGRAAPRAQRASLLKTLAAVSTAAQRPAPPWLARTGAPSGFVSFLLFLLVRGEWWGAALAAPMLPPLLQGSSLTWRPQPLFPLVHSVAVTQVTPAPGVPRVFSPLASAVESTRIPVHRGLLTTGGQ